MSKFSENILKAIGSVLGLIIGLVLLPVALLIRGISLLADLRITTTGNLERFRIDNEVAQNMIDWQRKWIRGYIEQIGELKEDNDRLHGNNYALFSYNCELEERNQYLENEWHAMEDDARSMEMSHAYDIRDLEQEIEKLKDEILELESKLRSGEHLLERLAWEEYAQHDFLGLDVELHTRSVNEVIACLVTVMGMPEVAYWLIEDLDCNGSRFIRGSVPKSTRNEFRTDPFTDQDVNRVLAQCSDMTGLEPERLDYLFNRYQNQL